MVVRNSAEISAANKNELSVSPKVPFLKSLRLANFKSVESCDLELAPLTILVGRNSSGKSTLIQSILLLAQNASAPDSRGLGVKGFLDINGSLITLGQFSELINDAASKADQTISIGCTFQFPIPSRGRWLELITTSSEELPNQDVDLWVSSNHVEPNLRGCNLEISTQFVENNNDYEKNLLKANVARARFSVNGFTVQEVSGNRQKLEESHSEYDVNEKYDPNFSTIVKTTANLKNRRGIHADSRNYLVFPNRSETRVLERTQFMLGTPVTGLESMNTLDIVMKYQNSFFARPQTIAAEIIRSFRGDPNNAKNASNNSLKEVDIDSSYKLAVDNYANKCIAVARSIENIEWGSDEYFSLGQELLPWNSLPIPVKKYLGDDHGDYAYFDERIAGTTAQEFGWWTEAEHDVYLLTEIGENLKPYQMNTRQLNSLRRAISSSIKEFWAEVKVRVNELKIQNQSLPTQVVSTGFALVEDLSEYDDENYLNLTVGYGVNRLREFLQKICYLGPLRKAPTEIYERFSTPGYPQTPLGFEGERLGQLVFENPVAQYPVPELDSDSNEIVTLIKKCSFKEALNAWLLVLGIAKSGISSIPQSHYGLKVTVDGRPLRSLGVGVSQVIPVIATCLVAGRGSMVLLEEPELHLNPSLQRQLADFFIAMTMPGSDRQLIVETHSEYLITRLRVHAVKSKERARLMKLLFASQSKTSSSSFSTYQELMPDENGEIPEWPELPGYEDGYFGQVPHDMQQLLRVLVERHKNSEMPD